MDLIHAVREAYQAENLPGSCLMQPFRTSIIWFQEKTENSQGLWQKIAWKIGLIAFAIFTLPIFGILALIGTAVNLFQILRTQKVSKTPSNNERIENFCKKLKTEFETHFPLSRSNVNYSFSLDSKTSLDNYTYIRKQEIEFKFNIPRDIKWAQAMKQADKHIQLILGKIRTLCQKLSFTPERYNLFGDGEKYFVRFPIPDHVPHPEFHLEQLSFSLI